MKITCLLFLIAFMRLPFLHAQPTLQPTKALDVAIVQKVIDSTTIGIQISLAFQCKEDEVRGEIITTKQRKIKNELRKSQILPALLLNPYDLKLNLEMYDIEADTSKRNDYKRQSYALLARDIEANPTDGSLYFQKGVLLESELKLQEAFTEYVTAQKYMPDSAKVYQRAGELYLFFLQYGEAKAYFEEALIHDITALNAHLFYAITDVFNAMTALSQAESEGQTIEEAIKKIQQDLVYVNRAIDLYPNRQDFKIFKLYARILWVFYKGVVVGAALSEANKTDFELDKMLLSSFFKFSKNDLNELRELKDAFEKMVAEKKVANLTLAYESLGFIALFENKIPKALAYFEKVSKLNTEKIQVYYNLCFIHLLRKDYKKGEASIKRKMILSKEAIDYQLLGSIYERQKKHEKAKSFCIEGLKKFPASTEIKAMLGMLEARTKNYAAAERYLQEVVDAKAPDGELLYKLALTQLAQQKWATAYANLVNAGEQKNAEAKIIIETYFKY